MLPDALHERLTTRFVDWRTNSLLRRLEKDSAKDLCIAVTRNGQIFVEEHTVGTVEGITLKSDYESTLPEQTLMLRASRKALLD